MLPRHELSYRNEFEFFTSSLNYFQPPLTVLWLQLELFLPVFQPAPVILQCVVTGEDEA